MTKRYRTMGVDSNIEKGEWEGLIVLSVQYMWFVCAKVIYICVWDYNKSRPPDIWIEIRYL